MFGKYVFKGFMWALCIAVGFIVYAFADNAGSDVSETIMSGDISEMNQKDFFSMDKLVGDGFSKETKSSFDKEEESGRFN